MKRISIYRDSKDVKGVTASFDAIVQRIKTGARGLDEKTKLCNILAQTDPEAYDKLKKRLPAAAWSGTFTQRSSKYLIDHSGYVVLDIDDTLDVGGVLADFALNPHIRFAFISPSARGVKPIIPVSPIPTTPEEHKIAFQAVLEEFEEYVTRDPKMLPKQSDVARLCFLAHDPQPLENPNAIPIGWDREAWQAEEAEREKGREARIAEYDNLPVDTAALDHINPDEDYQIWLTVGMGCHAAGVPFEAWDRWSSQGAKYNPDEMRSKWESFRGSGITWGSVVWIAKQNGYELPRKRRKQVKLEKSDIASVFEVLEKTGKRIAEAFASGKRFIGLRADTGTGKTEQAIKYFLKGYAGFFSTPTTELAKDIFNRFYKKEINSFRWRGLNSEPSGEFPHEKPCMFPEHYQALAENGRNAYRILCEGCQYILECEADGFRGQEEKAQKADVVIAAHPDLLMNPTFRRVAARLLPGRKDGLVMVDEFDPLRFIEIAIPVKRLEYLRDTWHDHALENFAIDILSTKANPKRLYSYLSKMIDDIYYRRVDNEIITALGSLRVGNTIMDSDEAHDYEIRTHQPLDLESIRQRPKLEDEDWNLLIQLKLFFDIYKHAETAPIDWQDDKLVFYVPPLPLPLKPKVILMSATLVKEFFFQVFATRQAKRDDVDFIDATDTEWHKDAKVYQLQTNRNPRRTLLIGEKDKKTGKWRYTGELSRTGKRFIDTIHTVIAAHPDKKHGLIAHKAIIEHHAEELKAAGVVYEHFGNLVGLDSKFKDIDVLQILGSPDVGSEAVKIHSMMMFGMTDHPLDFTRNEDGSYADPNVQKVADALVKSELIQAFGRARLVRNPASVILWTSLELPSVSHRPQTLLFDEMDIEAVDGNLDALPAVLTKRQAQETAEAEAIEDGDVQAVVETTGVSERTARRKTATARQQNKADRDAEICQRYANGQTQAQIKDAMGIGLATVNRVLKRQQF